MGLLCDIFGHKPERIPGIPYKSCRRCFEKLSFEPWPRRAPSLGDPVTVPAWVLSNLVMAAGCGVALDIRSDEMKEARKSLGIAEAE